MYLALVIIGFLHGLVFLPVSSLFFVIPKLLVGTKLELQVQKLLYVTFQLQEDFSLCLADGVTSIFWCACHECDCPRMH